MRDWPVTWQAERPTIIAKQEPPEPSHDQHGNRNADEGGEDRVVARQSAKASERQADYAEIGLWVGAVAALATAWAAWAAAQAARASEKAVVEAAKSNELSRELFASEQRPWVGIGKIRVNSVTISADDENSKTAHIIFCAMAKNYGKTPASNVRLRIRNCRFGQNSSEPTTELINEMKSDDGVNTFIGITIFPDTETEIISNVTATTQCEDGIINKASGMMVGVVDYRFDGAKTRHQTWFHFLVSYGSDAYGSIPMNKNLLPNEFHAQILGAGNKAT